MKRSLERRALMTSFGVLLPVTALASAGCSAAPGTEGTAQSSDALTSDITAAGRAHEHLMLTESAQANHDALVDEAAVHAARRNGHTLTYYGGPVVQSVHVVPVYWSSKVALQSNLNAFYAAISSGAEMSFLSQYSTASPKQTIGNGSRGTPFVDNQTTTNVTDAEVQAALTAHFNSGALPKPTASSYYPVHFPSGVTVTDSGGNKSCVVFCAYHGTYVYDGVDVYYGIVPDLGSGGCQSGCGGSSVLDNTTSVSSHEFAETVTDPAVGLATVYGPPLGWYNATYGEIGDICNGQQTTAVLGDGKSYTVQKLWSNKTSTCATP
jgi:hypothetical protein